MGQLTESDVEVLRTVAALCVAERAYPLQVLQLCNLAHLSEVGSAFRSYIHIPPPSFMATVHIMIGTECCLVT